MQNITLILIGLIVAIGTTTNSGVMAETLGPEIWHGLRVGDTINEIEKSNPDAHFEGVNTARSKEKIILKEPLLVANRDDDLDCPIRINFFLKNKVLESVSVTQRDMKNANCHSKLINGLEKKYGPYQMIGTINDGSKSKWKAIIWKRSNLSYVIYKYDPDTISIGFYFETVSYTATLPKYFIESKSMVKDL